MDRDDKDMAGVDYMEEDFLRVVESEDEFKSESESSSEGSTSEDSETEHQAEEEWTSIDIRKHFPFIGTPVMNVSSAKTPVDYFKLLFNTTFINLLISCINMHAVEIQMKRPIPGNEFKPTDVEEVYTLISIYLLMGYVKINEWAYYWDSHPLYNLKFENYMNKDRFSLLVKALAFKRKWDGPDNGDARRSWYDAAKPIADYFNGVMKTLVTPTKDLNIDKYTAHWFDELNFVRRKPERIRMHLLSDENGIFQRVYLCHPDSKNRGDDVVKYLLRDFFDTGHSLYACPFYTSVSLAEELLIKKTYLTGILRRKKNRNPAFAKKKLKIGSIKTLYNSQGVCVCNFRKTQTILSLSTEHSGSLNIRGKSMLPEMTSQYKEHTAGMFKRNQTLSDNAPQDITKKYNKTVLYLLQVMFMNAYVLYNFNRPEEKMNYTDFRRDILEHFLPIPKNLENCESDEDTDASVDSMDQRMYSEVIHLPAKLGKGKKTTRNCRHCWLENGVRKSTFFYCPQCPQKWGLCIECFRRFHNY